jgi:hypothetical protein
MARIRTVKPEFWTSEQVVECSTTARLLFIGMWNFCDDGGNHPASIKSIKMQVFPGDDISFSQIGGMIDELLGAGLIIKYACDGCEYWHVTGWKHQKIDKPSFKYPKPSKSNEQPTCSPFDDHSTNDSQPLDDCPPAEGKGKESKGKESSGGEGEAKPKNHEPDFFKTEPAPEAPHRIKMLMTLEWQPSGQLKARAIPQGVNPDLIKPETLAAFRSYYEAKGLENNQGEWENLLIRWFKTQRNEAPRPAAQPAASEGPGWMALQQIKRDPKPPTTDADRELARKAKLQSGLK